MSIYLNQYEQKLAPLLFFSKYHFLHFILTSTMRVRNIILCQNKKKIFILCQFILTGTNKNWAPLLFFVNITAMSFYLDWYNESKKYYLMSIYLDWYELKWPPPFFFFVKITSMSFHLDWCHDIKKIFYIKNTFMSFYLDCRFVIEILINQSYM